MHSRSICLPSITKWWLSPQKKQQTTNNKQRTTNNQQRTTNNEQQTTNNKQQTTTTNNQQPTTNNKQLTTNNQQQTTNNQQQTTNNKQQTTNNKQQQPHNQWGHMTCQSLPTPPSQFAACWGLSFRQVNCAVPINTIGFQGTSILAGCFQEVFFLCESCKHNGKYQICYIPLVSLAIFVHSLNTRKRCSILTCFEDDQDPSANRNAHISASLPSCSSAPVITDLQRLIVVDVAWCHTSTAPELTWNQEISHEFCLVSQEGVIFAYEFSPFKSSKLPFFCGTNSELRTLGLGWIWTPAKQSTSGEMFSDAKS